MRHGLRHPLERFLDQVARRGSWAGGGSVAALSAALAAALLEKLSGRPSVVRRMRTVRRACLRLAEQDAKAFARVIRATRGRERGPFVQALRAATDIPWQIFQHAQLVQRSCRTAQRAVKPRFQSDLRCAMAVALAASESARTLIITNLAWLGDSRYTKVMQRRLHTASRRGAVT